MLVWNSLLPLLIILFFHSVDVSRGQEEYDKSIWVSQNPIPHGEPLVIKCFDFMRINNTKRYELQYVPTSLAQTEAWQTISEQISRSEVVEFHTDRMLRRYEGLYQCQFSDTSSTDTFFHTSLVNITVQDWAPEKSSLLILGGNDSTKYLMKGQKLKMKCISNYVADFYTVYINEIRSVQSLNNEFQLDINDNEKIRLACAATKEGQESLHSDSVTVVLVDPPTIHTSSLNEPVLGDDFLLTCLTQSKITVRFEWIDLRTSQVKSENNTLEFRPISLEDSSVYQCRTYDYNDTLVAHSKFHLRFTVPYTPRLLYTESDTHVTVYCETSEQHTKIYRYNSSTQMKSRKQTFFHAADETSHYSCEAINNFGGNSKRTSETIILPKDTLSITRETDKVTSEVSRVVCESRRPEVTSAYSWSLITKDLEFSILSHGNSTEPTSGCLRCQARINEVVLLSSTFYSNTELSPPTLTGHVTRSEWVLACSSFCNSFRKFRLYKNGEETDDYTFYDEVRTDADLLPYVVRNFKIQISDNTEVVFYKCTTFDEKMESHDSNSVQVIPEPAVLSSISIPSLNDNLTLTCTNVPTSIPEWGVKWFIVRGHLNAAEIEVDKADYERDRNQYENNENKLLFQTGRVLNLLGLKHEDQGTYACGVYNEDSVLQCSQGFQITLEPPLIPRLVLDSDNNKNGIHVYGVNQNISGRCITEMIGGSLEQSQNSGVSMTLYVDNSQVTAIDSSGIFTLTRPAPGTIRIACAASNRHSHSTRSSPERILTIEDLPVISGLGSLMNGDSVELTCQTLQTSNGQDIIWEKNGRLMAETSTRLELDQIDKLDEARYTCRHKMEGVLHPRSQPFPISFSEPTAPKVFLCKNQPIELNQEVEVCCLARGSTHEVLFPVGDVLVTEYDDLGQTLYKAKIKKLSRQDSGLHTCTLRNNFGIHETSIELIVKGCPIGKHYEPSCSKDCDCSGSPCDSQTGRCLCALGFTGAKCEESVNDCENSTKCGPNSRCLNTTQGHRCVCLDGTEQLPGQMCHGPECSKGYWGNNCDLMCECDASGSISMSCDKQTGNCLCRTGFFGQQCDIPECSDGTWGRECKNLCVCGQYSDSTACDVVEGQCSCVEGWTGFTCDTLFNPCLANKYTCSENKRCLHSQKGEYQCVSFESVEFELRLKGASFPEEASNTSSIVYAQTVTELQNMLRTTIIPGLLESNITSIKYDRAIVELIINTESNSNYAGTLARYFVELDEQDLTIMGVNYTSRVYLNNRAIDSYNSPCEILNIIKPCSSTLSCVVLNKIPACKPPVDVEDDESDSKLKLILALSIGFGLLLLISLAAGIYLIRRDKIKGVDLRS